MFIYLKNCDKIRDTIKFERNQIGGFKLKTIKKLIASIILSALVVSMVGCSMVEKTEEGINKTVVAKVLGEKITIGEIDEQLAIVLKNLEKEYGADYAKNEEAKQYLQEQRLSVLNTMINDVIIREQADKLGVMPTEEQLNEASKKQLEEIKASFNTEEEYKKSLEQAGLTEEMLLNEIQPSVISDKVYEEVVKDVSVKDEEIKNEYNSNQLKYTEKPNRVRPAHILVKTEEEAKAIIERLNKGEDFAAVAKEKGTDGTKDKGGDLDWIEYTTTQYDKTFMMSAISLPKGEYTKTPIATQSGYHVIKCLDKEEYPVKKLEEVKETINSELLEQKKYTTWQEKVKAWQSDSKIKVYENKLSL